jgi:opacity protein-like surface antigen
MKKLLFAAALAGLVAAPALAQQSTAPGQKMQQSGSVSGTTGASGYAPGRKMHKSMKGASRFAPGHEKKTVGMSRGDRDDMTARSQTSATKSTTSTKKTTGVSKY